MSTNDPGTASSGPILQASHDPTQQVDDEAGSTDTKRVEQSGPDTGVRLSTLASRTFRAAGLSQARETLLQEVNYLICLSTDHLWKCYSPDDRVVAGVKQYLTEKHWFSKNGEWNEIDGVKIIKRRFEVRGKGKDDGEVKTFVFFARLFNTVLEHFQQNKHPI